MALIRPIPTISGSGIQEVFYTSRLSGAGSKVIYTNDSFSNQDTSVNTTTLNNNMINFTTNGTTLTATHACSVMVNLNGTVTTQSLSIGDSIDLFSNDTFFSRTITVM